MNIPCILLSLCAATPQVSQSQRAQVIEDGVIKHLFREAAPSPQRTNGGTSESGADDECVRWVRDDNFQNWIPDKVAVGDSGACAFAGQELNDSRLAMYSAGSSIPLYEVLEPNTYDFYVDAAANDSVVAALTTFANGKFVEARLTVYEDFDSAPLWSHDFPTGTLYRAGGGVGVSRDGQRIVAVWPHTTRGLMVRAFNRDGSKFSFGVIQDDFPTAFRVEMDSAGNRLAIRGTGETLIYDIVSRRLEHVARTNGIGNGVDVSGDGMRVALAHEDWDGRVVRGVAEVLERDSNGSWSTVYRRAFKAGTRCFQVALDHDGSRIGVAVQVDTLAEFDIRLIDVDQGTRYFKQVFEAPGTTLQLVCYGLALDDAGEVLAGVSWGDSLNATPEGFAIDDTGTIRCSIDTRGSGMDVDISPDGEVMVIGCKGTHANNFGNGGDVVFVESTHQDLRVRGVAAIGETLTVELDAPGTSSMVWLPIATSLLADIDAELRIDLSTMITALPPILVGAADLQAEFDLPADGALVGLDLHLQALVLEIAGGDLRWTNKSSLRIGS